MKKNKKTNDIITDHGEYLEVDISTPGHPDASMLVDKCDWDFIQSLGYGLVYACQLSGGIYAMCCEYLGKKGGRSIQNHHKVHRLLLPESACVDHINHNGLDNRSCNIRSCSNSENKRNSRIRSDSSTGSKGVSVVKDGGFRARISFEGKRHFIGCFTSIEEASAAYNAKAIELHGKFAYSETMANK